MGRAVADAAVIAARPEASTRLESLTGLRFFAALTVFALHLELSGDVPALHLQGVSEQGGLGVSFFFVLSGFVLTWSWRRGRTAPDFYRGRFARIYPAHLVTWMLALLVFIVVAGDEQSILHVGQSLALLQAWTFDDDVALAGNPVSWTLSVEALFYALFPLLFRGLLSLKPAHRTWLLIALVAVRMAVMVVGQGSLTFFPPARLPEFVIGMLLALALKDGWIPRIPLPAAALFGVGTYVLVGPVRAVALISIVAIAMVIVAAAQADLADRPSLLRHPALVRLGVWSFAFYLCHRFVITLVPRGLDQVGSELEETPLGQVALASLLLGMSVIAAATLHRLVERPAQRWLGRRGAGAELPRQAELRRSAA